MISVVLIEPKNPANIGAVARAMKNFGFRELVLISPKCRHLSDEARNLAKHAQDVLEHALVKPRSFLSSFDLLVATTAKLGTDYNLPRSPISPEQLSERLSKAGAKSGIALLIGREDIGLTNREIQGCDFSVSIPASKEYPTLSISHSAAVLLYEISKLQKFPKSTDNFPLAPAREKELLLKKADALLARLGFSTKEKLATQKRLWRRLIGKSFLTMREAFALFGFFRKLEHKLTRR
jgi:TrmH family RNA methyltransferase